MAVARIPRKLLVAVGTVNHCTWRSHNFTHCLGTDAAKRKFLDLLLAHKEEHGIEIYSYSLMDSHPHVQCYSRLGQRAFSRFWQIVNYRFARWYNRSERRRGQVIMERMTSGRVQDDSHQLMVMRYGDSNPVRAGLAKSAKAWRWSSYRHYAFGSADALVTDAPAYVALGSDNIQRRRAYVQLFALRKSEPMQDRRIDLVADPFIGSPDWVIAQAVSLTTPPPPS